MSQFGSKTAQEGVKMKNFAQNLIRKIGHFWNIFVQKGVNPKSLVAALLLVPPPTQAADPQMEEKKKLFFLFG